MILHCLQDGGLFWRVTAKMAAPCSAQFLQGWSRAHFCVRPPCFSRTIRRFNGIHRLQWACGMRLTKEGHPRQPSDPHYRVDTSPLRRSRQNPSKMGHRFRRARLLRFFVLLAQSRALQHKIKLSWSLLLGNHPQWVSASQCSTSCHEFFREPPCRNGFHEFQQL